MMRSSQSKHGMIVCTGCRNDEVYRGTVSSRMVVCMVCKNDEVLVGGQSLGRKVVCTGCMKDEALIVGSCWA